MFFGRRLTECNILLLMWTVIAVASADPAVAQDPALALEQSLTKVIEQSEAAVVSIARLRLPNTEPLSTQTRPLDVPRFPDPQRAPGQPDDLDYQPNNFGAGIVIAGAKPGERVVLTNYHVVSDGPISGHAELLDGVPSRVIEGAKIQLLVRFADRRSCYATIVAADPRSDLAVLAPELEPANIDSADLKSLDWSTSSPVKKGQLVVMLGNPYALAYDGSASASWGMISNLARRPLPWTEDAITRTKMYRLGNLIQIDGRLNLGTSGGPLLNLKGELVGLTTSLAAIEGYDKSAGFAIPIDDLNRRIVKSLVGGHEVEYGMLGIKPETVGSSRLRNLSKELKQAAAARIEYVADDSPAHRAGLRADDIILAIGENPVFSEHDVMRLVGLHAPDSEVEVVIWRKDSELGRKLRLKARLGKWPVLDDEGIIETTPRFAAWRGISVDYPTGRHRYYQPDDPYRRAVVITRADGPALAAGLQPGKFIAEVNKTPVQTPAEFVEATKSLKGPVELKLLEMVKTGFGNQYVRNLTKVKIGE